MHFAILLAISGHTYFVNIFHRLRIKSMGGGGGCVTGF